VLVGVVRADGRPPTRMTVQRFAGRDHIAVSRRGRARGPLDEYLAGIGLTRRVVAVVPSFSAALAMVAQSDAVTLAPRRLATLLAANGGLRLFVPPVPLPTVRIDQIWHDRDTADPPHDWFRRCVRHAASSA
jgi:DNA-binding transcriptional LysR family regulator